MTASMRKIVRDAVAVLCDPDYRELLTDDEILELRRCLAEEKTRREGGALH